MKVLFVCSQNRLRSPTAEEVFTGHPDLDVMSAGTNKDAATTVTGDLIEWADVVVVMEPVHRNKVAKRFRHLMRGKRIIVLGIPDDYDYMDPQLVRLLSRRVSNRLGISEPS